ncbi:MAG: hypothetical protein U1E53_33475 [Dongiaceae bacterium]
MAARRALLHGAGSKRIAGSPATIRPTGAPSGISASPRSSAARAGSARAGAVQHDHQRGRRRHRLRRDGLQDAGARPGGPGRARRRRPARAGVRPAGRHQPRPAAREVAVRHVAAGPEGAVRGGVGGEGGIGEDQPAAALDPDGVAGRGRDREVAVDDGGQRQARPVAGRQRQRRGDAEAQPQPAAGRHREGLHQNAVGAGGGHQQRVAPTLHHALIGPAGDRARGDGGLALLAVDPQGGARDDAARRQRQAHAPFGGPGRVVAQLQGPFEVGDRIVGRHRAVDPRALERQPGDPPAHRGTALVRVEVEGTGKRPRPVAIGRRHRVEGVAGQPVIELAGILGIRRRRPVVGRRQPAPAHHQCGEQAGGPAAAVVAEPQQHLAVPGQAHQRQAALAQPGLVAGRPDDGEARRRRGQVEPGHHGQAERHADPGRPGTASRPPHRPPGEHAGDDRRGERRQRQQPEPIEGDGDHRERIERQEHQGVEGGDRGRAAAGEQPEATRRHGAAQPQPEAEIGQRHGADQRDVPRRGERVEEDLGAQARRQLEADRRRRQHDAGGEQQGRGQPSPAGAPGCGRGKRIDHAGSPTSRHGRSPRAVAGGGRHQAGEMRGRCGGIGDSCGHALPCFRRMRRERGHGAPGVIEAWAEGPAQPRDRFPLSKRSNF